MATDVIIPVKNLNKAKARLSSLLSINERKELCLRMLKDVLTEVKDVKQIRQTIVVSADERVLKFAKTQGAEPFVETQTGLNRALSEVIDRCVKNEADCVLILPSDVPLVTPQAIIRILSLGRTRSIVIAPSKDWSGTNALLLSPPNIIPTMYGKHSFQRHIQEASKQRIDCIVENSTKISLDIDTAKDLTEFASLKPKATHAYKFLIEAGILKRLN